MSDLSAPFLPATSLANGSPALRGLDANAQADAAPKNGEGSFSSVLSEKVSKTKEPSADKTPPARSSTPEKPEESSASKESATADAGKLQEATASATASETAAQTIVANSPLATMLLQLLPRGAVTDDAATGDQDTSAAVGVEVIDAGLTPAESVLAAMVTTGVQSLGNSASTPKEASPSLVPQAIVAFTGTETEASTLGLTEAATVVASAGVEQQTSFSANADSADSAITADAKAALAGEARGKDESNFSQLLGRAQEATGQANATALRGANATENTTHMQHAAGHPNWSNELGDKLTWMVTTQKQQAELVLNPPQLGRIEVSLTVSGDQANAVFTSPNAAVRELIENSLPRLREILAGSGLNLGQADVGAQSFSQQRGEQTADNRQNGSNRGSFVDGLPGLHEIAAASGSMNLGRPGERPGMVDIFA